MKFYRTGLFPMTLLIFFPAAAGTKIISADFFSFTLDRSALRRFSPVHLHLLSLWKNGGDRHRTLLLLLDDLNAEEVLHRIPFDPLDHLGKQLKPFPLVFGERVLLSISPQPDPFFEIVHRQQVIFPMRVDHPEENLLFQLPD